jgi:dienelactone hydrolase
MEISMKALLFLLCATAYAQDLTKPVLPARQSLIETQIYLASRVPALPPVPDAAAWTKMSDQLRRQVLDNVIFRGEAARWRTLPSKPEWLDTLPGNGYRVRKFRYQVVPGMWLPGLLYEPAELRGRVPVVVNLNGHEGAGVSIDYIQQRCIHLARNGILALNFEWFSKGQMAGKDYEHSRLNQIDLTGSSGVAVFFLAHQRLLDIGLQHPNADPARVAVTGLSGGGWQTIMLSALDPRVRLSVPVAGYSSFVTRAQFPEKDLGDSEQTPVDLARYADYTHLTAMLAPRPAMISHNGYDNCCFRADYALSPLLVAAQPIYRLYGKELRFHANFDQGHNYGLENRQALYRFLRQSFYPNGGGPPDEEAPADLRTAEALKMPLPEDNLNLHTLAVSLTRSLPRNGATREKLRELVRWPQYSAAALQPGRLSLDGIWSVPYVELGDAGAKGVTLVFGDAGKAKLAEETRKLTEAGKRVVAIDPWYFGESHPDIRDYLFALLASAVGERPLGIQAGQVAAVARWLRSRYGTVEVEAFGPRTSLIGLVAAAMETEAIASVKLHRPMTTLKDPIDRDLGVSEAPELFCFGLLEWFDMPQLRALVNPRPVVVTE